MPDLSESDLDAIDASLVTVASGMREFVALMRALGIRPGDAAALMQERLAEARRVLRETDPHLQ